jgi:hypothetical protein
VLQQRDGIDHLLAIGSRNVEVIAVVGADRNEAGIEAARLHRAGDVLDARAHNEAHAHRLDMADFAQQLGAQRA